MASGNYADLTWLKRKLNISDEDDDPDLDDSVESANRFVDDVLSRHAATVPVTDTDLLDSCTWVANCEAMRDYKLTKQDIETSKEWKTTRKEKLDNLIAKLAKDPDTNTQSKFVAVATTYKTNPLHTRTGI